MRKRNIFSWIACILLLVALCGCGEPEEYSVEVSEVANITYSADDDAVTALSDSNIDIDEKGIYSVHGIIIRSEACEKEGKYILVESEEKPEGICFSYEAGVDEEIATGSEIVIKGTFEYNDKDQVLVVESMEVKNQLYPVHKFDSVSDLLKSANDYVNKKVSVKGLVYMNEDTGSYLISNSKKTKTVVLEKLSEKEKTNLEYGTYRATGQFYFNDGEATIEVEKIKLIKKKDKPQDITCFDSPEELTAVSRQYDGKKVSVTGWIELAGAAAYMMGGDEPIELIGITNAEAEELYGGYSLITGTFWENTINSPTSTAYCIHVDKIGY